MSSKNRWNDPFRHKEDPRATLTRHRARLMAMDGVVSVGLGFDDAHRTVIVVGMAGDAPSAQSVPEDLEGVPVQVRQVGKLSTADGEKAADAADEG